MSETTFDDEVRAMAESFNALRSGAAILYNTINHVYSLHELVTLTSPDGEEQEACGHCSEIAGEERGIAYPCPTVAILTEYLVTAEAPEENGDKNEGNDNQNFPEGFSPEEV